MLQDLASENPHHLHMQGKGIPHPTYIHEALHKYVKVSLPPMVQDLHLSFPPPAYVFM